MDQAGQVGHHRSRPRPNKLWAQVDKEVTDQAPWVAMFNPKYIDFALVARQGLPVQPAVVLPPRPGVGEVTRTGRAWLSSPSSRGQKSSSRPARAPRRSPGGAPGASPGAGSCATGSRWPRSACSSLIVVVSLLAPVLREPRREHRPVLSNSHGHDQSWTARRSTSSRTGQRRARSRRDPDRADVAVELLHRRRQPGPRRDGARALRRPRLARRSASPRRCICCARSRSCSRCWPASSAAGPTPSSRA